MPLFVGLIFMACEKPIEMNDMEIQEKGPDQEGWNVTIYLSDEGSLTAKIRAGHLEKYHEKQFALLDSGVVIDFFDGEENHTSNLKAIRAEVDQKSNDMVAMGQVVAISDSGMTLYTDTLTWDSKKEIMFTKDSIMLTTQYADTLYGVGFESDSDLNHWKILKPSGVSNRELKK
ncbi:MAG: LPS export ABC transporter periplasmic protein LptC [Candidatus Marinimicrobia bacterium]|jgi:LPS export ABC transporter protein LptC|nr:LPS export ABC transporter periplasmic protein LptC [Candidatus Neomarinimicrobiota bacterium]MBT3732909.1 LPS export ABC transporter periplasmic protein LptC [Candidatus Neomarinimicrobiota bacterium]MBT4144051.1 LPS export ABC transporter periplasmic protein LptC [Candidatus Neomarinimicrobiota bacterium]MBT4177257.1 LPS export ABC transporter periplasmic protein LptC [Candidatus Neomarinimicrobiota bacterium]MBT4594103.1 LPS export ABC transporter periplasmic protein LptC [Candidatus Neom